MIGSNNYLGLTSDPRVKQAAIEAVKNSVPDARDQGSSTVQ